jgi:drug/metabolite transporter superfamily protein YnfA
MNKTYLIAALAGVAAGYLLASKLRNTKPFAMAYAKGVAFAGTAS